MGVFPGKAVLVVDGDGPFTVPAGGTRAGVRVVSVDEAGAVVEVDGRRRSLPIGSAPLASSAARVDASRVVVAPDARGHYVAQGAVNGAPVRFLVDTGATAVTIPSDVARRAGIDASAGQTVTVSTANGRVFARRVRVDRVSLGDMTLHQVDAIVHDGLGEHALLGMSFLSRTDLRREGDRLVLVKRL